MNSRIDISKMGEIILIDETEVSINVVLNINELLQMELLIVDFDFMEKINLLRKPVFMCVKLGGGKYLNMFEISTVFSQKMGAGRNYWNVKVVSSLSLIGDEKIKECNAQPPSAMATTANIVPPTSSMIFHFFSSFFSASVCPYIAPVHSLNLVFLVFGNSPIFI